MLVIERRIMIYKELMKQIEEKEITITRLALELMIAPNNLHAAIKGKIPFYKKYRVLIAEFFGKSEEELFPGIEEI